MDTSQPLKAIKDYLALFESGNPPREQDLCALAEALDRLAYAYHCLPEGSPSDRDENPPRPDYEAIRRIGGARFPALGCYNTLDVLGSEAGNAEVLVGDALDDLSDIAIELGEVLWLWENTSPDNAIWHFKSMYRAHWGRHLHNLRSYLHAIQFES